jgi:hypothetical protein
MKIFNGLNTVFTEEVINLNLIGVLWNFGMAKINGS